VVLLTGVQTHPQALVRPTERLQHAPRIAGRILDVHVAGAGRAIQAGIVKERSAEQQFAVIRDAARVGDAFRDQVLAHRVALHAAVRFARGSP
jgi:hypothetical protein